MNDEHQTQAGQPASPGEPLRAPPVGGGESARHIGRRRFVISTVAAPTMLTLGAVAAETQLIPPAFAQKKNKQKHTASKLASVAKKKKG